MDVQTPRAREYLRVSQDRSGRQRSVDEQHLDNARAAEGAGLTLGEPYRERNGVSASRYSTKVRDAFGRLLADLDAGDFGAEVLMLWESSRGSRRVGEWVTLIELCEEQAVKVYVTTHGRMYDPANPRDRRALLEDAVDSEYESSKVSARTGRAMAASAAAGRPHGVPAYGYRRRFDARTGALITWEAHPEEAPVVVELYERLRAGESFRAIAKDFEARGIRNRIGNPFAAAQLRSTIKPAHIGRRVHRGEILPGTWEPLIPDELYYQVRRIIDDPARRTTRHGRAVYEFTMILRCDVCGGPLALTRRSDGRRPGGEEQYQCQRKGCVRIPRVGVDEIVLGAIVGYLSRPDVYEALSASREDSVEVRRLDADLARLRAELAEAERTTPRTVHEAKTLARLAEALTGDIGAKETRQRELTVPPALRNLVQPGVDVAERWKAAPLPARRKVAEILLSPGYLGEVRVKPSPERARRVPAAERLVFKREG